MSRTSAAALSVVLPAEEVERPPPPKHLSAAAKREWIAIVGRMPADWFPRETHPMLTQLVRLITTANDIDKRLRARDLKPADFKDLFKMQREVSVAIATLSTRMRISQQSKYDRRKHRDGSIIGADPWNDTPPDED